MNLWWDIMEIESTSINKFTPSLCSKKDSHHFTKGDYNWSERARSVEMRLQDRWRNRSELSGEFHDHISNNSNDSTIIGYFCYCFLDDFIFSSSYTYSPRSLSCDSEKSSRWVECVTMLKTTCANKYLWFPYFRIYWLREFSTGCNREVHETVQVQEIILFSIFREFISPKLQTIRRPHWVDSSNTIKSCNVMVTTSRWWVQSVSEAQLSGNCRN